MMADLVSSFKFSGDTPSHPTHVGRAQAKMIDGKVYSVQFLRPVARYKQMEHHVACTIHP